MTRRPPGRYRMLLLAAALGMCISQSAVCQYVCPGDSCGSADCRCASRVAPGKLSHAETPQFILVTFDDGINSYSESLVQPSVGDLHNPDGSSAPLTYFVTKVNTDAALARKRFLDGNELANHTTTHLTGVETTVEQWRQELSGLNQFLVNQVGLPSDQIAGFRAPDLATNEPLWQVEKEDSFLYDASIPEIITIPRLVSTGPDSLAWPHTLDYRSGLACKGNHCPDSPIPGLWSIPLWVYYDSLGNNYGAMDPATSSDSLFRDVLEFNFQQRYLGNRCPLGIFMHAGQLGSAGRRDVLRAFLAEKLQLPEVWMITMRGLIEWMRNPVPVSALPDWFSQGRQRGVGRIATSPPVTPSLLMPPDNSSVPPGGVTLNWDVLLTASSYHLQVSGTSDFSVNVLDTMFLAAATFTLQSLPVPAHFFWRVRGINTAGAGGWSEQRRFDVTSTTATTEERPLPSDFRLDQSYPDPFNPSTTISFSLPSSMHVTLRIFNALGMEVTMLMDGQLAAGMHSVVWNASQFASGPYFYQIQAGSYREQKRMILLR